MDADFNCDPASVHGTDPDSLLEPDDLARYERAFVKASYSLGQFKSEVLAWLKKGFGEGVKAGKKPSTSLARDR